MKFIIDNYSNNSSSQALYIHKYINEQTDNKCALNNNEIPMFDLLDKIQPDVYISQINILSRDLIQYIRQTGYKLNLLINIDNSKLGTILEIEEILNEQKVDFRFFGNMSCVKPISTKKTKVFNLLDGFDVNLVDTNRSNWNKKIDHLIVTKYDVDLQNIDLDKLKNKTFHICSFDNQSEINTSVIDAIQNLYHNYDSVIFTNLEYGINQPFFDCLYGKCKTFFASKMYNKEINKTLSKILKIKEDFNFNNHSRITNFDLAFTNVENHGSNRRVKSLLSQISESK